MNERQQRAQAQIMSIISMLPWTERPRVMRAVNLNDEICLKCGRVTERWGTCRCGVDGVDGTGWAEAAFCDDVDPAQREIGMTPTSFNAASRQQMAAARWPIDNG